MPQPDATDDAAAAAERFAAAHRALRADADMQWQLLPADPPPPPPAWLKSFGEWLERVFAPLGRLLRRIGAWMPDLPYAKIVLYGVLGAVALLALWMLVVRLREGQWRWPRWRRARVTVEAAAEEEAWTPGAAPARALLEEADALAAGGAYAEAVHLLLVRSVEDIARRRPRLVRPALTSRDLAGADAIPGPARGLFAGIARVVERSLFGGRPVGADDWSRARAAYADFALAGAWRG
jgi:hypothetical protein